MRHMERWETMDMRRVEGIEGVDLRCGSRIVGVQVGMKFLKNNSATLLRASSSRLIRKGSTHGYVVF